MELETKLPAPDREARRVIEDNFQKIQDEINKISRSEERPQEVKMADNSTPPLANGGAMIINLTSKEDK